MPSDAMNTTIEKGRQSVREWYYRHRNEFSDLRKQRYAEDPERRERARKAAAKYRKERRKGVVVSRVLTRTINGVTVPVYTSGYIADRLQCSPQVIRNWEARGWIPKPLFEDKHRLYTERQFALLRLLADTLRHRSSAGLRSAQYSASPVLEDVFALIRKTWEIEDNGGQSKQKGRRRAD